MFSFLRKRRVRPELAGVLMPTKRVARLDPETGELVPVSDPRMSLAVLMFDAPSHIEEDSVFASGISSEVIRYVTTVPDIRVNSRPTSFPFLSGAVDISAVAESLNTRYVLTGKVERAGDRIQVEAQLHDVEIGRVIWSQFYDQLLDKMFEVQRDIARRIVGAVMGEVKLAETLFAGEIPEQQLDSWGLVNKAYYFWLTKFRPEAILEACNHLREAIEIDPDNANARAALAMLLAQQMTTRICKDYTLCCDAAEELIETAYKRAPNDVEVLENAGVTWQNLGQSDRSVEALRKAVSIAPLNLIARGYLALTLSFTQGRDGAEEAKLLIEDNFATAPKHPSTSYWYYFLAVAEQRLSNNEAALEYVEASLKLQPGWIHGYYLAANAHAMLGQSNKAEEMLIQAAEISPYLNSQLYADNVLKITGSAPACKPFIQGLWNEGKVAAL